MLTNIKRRGLAMALGLLLAATAGCTPGAKTAYTGADAVDVAVKAQQATIEDVIRTQKEGLERMYGGGLYTEDFSKEIQQADAYFQTRLASEYVKEAPAGYTTTIYAHNQYYNDSLKALKAGTLTVEEIYKDTKKHIRKVQYDRFNMTPAGKDENLQLHEQWDDRFYEVAGNQDLYIRICHLKAGAEIPPNAEDLFLKGELNDQLARNERIAQQFYLLRDKGNYYGDWYFDTNIQKVNTIRSLLEAKYNEPFRFVDGIRKGKMNNLSRFAPVSRPELVFVAKQDMVDKTLINDIYTRVLAQKLVGEEVNRIIEAEGGAGYIGQYTYPRDAIRQLDKELGEYPYNTGELSDLKDFIFNGYKGKYQITLTYLKTPEEEIDFEQVKRITDSIFELIEDRFDKESVFNQVYVKFYEVKESDKPLITQLMKEYQIADTWGFEEKPDSMAMVFVDSSRNRADTDAFNYVDTHGEMLDYVIIAQKTYETMEEYMLKCKQSSTELY